MRAAVYYNNSDVRTEEVENPEIEEGEILVKIMASGICGSDVMEWYRIKKAPLVLGHEISGIVEESKNENFEQGDRVMSTHHVPCYECKYCESGHETVCDSLRNTKFYPGGFAEFVRIPKINVKHGTLKLPEEISFEEGTFLEPLGCVVRGQRIAGIKKGQKVLILGSGISGLLHIQLAKYLGAESVIATDISDYRLKKAEELGADKVYKADELPADLKAERVIVCTGAMPAIEQAFKSVDKGGTILFFAPTKPDANVEMPLWDLWKDCVTLTTTYAAARGDLLEAFNLIKNKSINIEDMITHRLPLEETQKGFKLVAEAEDSVKVIIEPNK